MKDAINNLLARYEREYAEKLQLHDEALRKYKAEPTDADFRNKLHAKHMLMDAFIAHGKIKAAREILSVLAEASNEDS